MRKLIANIQDLSKRSEKYLDYLVKLCRDKDLSLMLIHSYSNISNNLRPTAVTGVGLMYPETLVQEDDRKEREDSLEKLIAPFREKWDYINYSVGHGDLMQKINNESKAEHVSLCAIQKTSQYNWVNEIFGTKELSLGKQTDIPCLYIPFNYSYAKPERVLVFVNEYKAQDIEKLEILASRLKLKLKIVTDQNLDDKDIERIKNGLKDTTLIDQDITRLDKLSYSINVIEDMVDKSQMDWLCFINYNKSFFERIYDLNTNKLLLRSERPSIIL